MFSILGLAVFWTLDNLRGCRFGYFTLVEFRGPLGGLLGGCFRGGGERGSLFLIPHSLKAPSTPFFITPYLYLLTCKLLPQAAPDRSFTYQSV